MPSGGKRAARSQIEYSDRLLGAGLSARPFLVDDVGGHPDLSGPRPSTILKLLTPILEFRQRRFQFRANIL